ncbi:hypothetical protein J6590_015577 [Homalodisca vitripennis]|nr:hypothetical protein J6590_015577 [Homalodisca vitripennis]
MTLPIAVADLVITLDEEVTDHFRPNDLRISANLLVMGLSASKTSILKSPTTMKLRVFFVKSDRFFSKLKKKDALLGDLYKPIRSKFKISFGLSHPKSGLSPSHMRRSSSPLFVAVSIRSKFEFFEFCLDFNPHEFKVFVCKFGKGEEAEEISFFRKTATPYPLKELQQ